MTYPRAVTARLLDTDGSTVIGGSPLAKVFDVEFLDELSGPGTGSCAIPLSEAGSAEAVAGRYVDILVEGTSRFTFAIEGDPEYTVVGQGDELEAVVRVSGRGWGCILDQAIVHPEVDIDLDLDSPWRLFSFASPSFPNDSGWVAADELYEYLDGVDYGDRYTIGTDGLPYPAPIDFPAPTSPVVNESTWAPGETLPVPPGPDYVPVYWIWPPGEEDSIGEAFFRTTITIVDDGPYVFAVTGDNYYTLFLEGVPILGEDEDQFCWRNWKEIPVTLVAGTYQVAAIVENVPIAVGLNNPGGFIMTVHTVNGQQLPNEVFLVSDAAWDTFWSDTVWPGWTPGQIIDKVTDEATAQGALTAYDSASFTDSDDSASNAWADVQDGSPYIPSFAADVGSTIMAMLGKMKDEGHIDWHMQPGAAVLDVWSPSSLGGSSGAELQAGVNLMSLVRGATTVYANYLLVQYEKGYVIVEDTAAQTSRGDTIQDVYASEAATRDEAERQGNVELERRAAEGLPAVLVEIEPTSSADCPYEGFTLGETVEIPAVGGGTENLQVLSIGLSTDGDGFAIWRCELGRRWRSKVRQDYELLRQIGGRSGIPTGTVQ